MSTVAVDEEGFLILDDSLSFTASQNSEIPALPVESNPNDTLSVRCLQFVATPGKTAALCDAIHEVVTPILAANGGFQGVIVLVSKREPRLVSVYTFAEMKTPAAESRWELIPAVRNMLHRLVDQCLNEDTLHASLPRAMPQCVFPRRA
ncbi:MAG: hypothetical protein PVS2B2_00790 [Candidatus Acidiferrum sp.]